LLPPKPKIVIPTGDNVEEVSMVDFENTRGSKSSQKAREGPTYASHMMEEDDDEEDEGGAGQRVECNTH